MSRLSEQISDEELMMSARAGNVAAFEMLVRRHYDGLAFYIHQMLGDRESARDLAQETFLRAYRARERYEPRARWVTWVRKIARNLSLDECRRQRLGRYCSLDEAEVRVGTAGTFPLYDVIPDRQTPLPDGLICQEEALEEMRGHLDGLSPKHAQVLKMRVYEEMNYREIADRLGCSLGTVKSRIHYAVKELRARVAHDVAEENTA